MGKKLSLKVGDRNENITISKIFKVIKIKKNYYKRLIEVKCDCGKKKIIQSKHFYYTKSCGCLIKENSGISGRFKPIHGDSQEHNELVYLYHCWASIKQRCYNVNHKSYKTYGAKGIKMEYEWFNSYELFKEWILENIGKRPEGYSLDRINNKKGYLKGNLRWADWITQNNNTSRNVNNKKRKEMKV